MAAVRFPARPFFIGRFAFFKPVFFAFLTAAFFAALGAAFFAARLVPEVALPIAVPCCAAVFFAAFFDTAFFAVVALRTLLRSPGLVRIASITVTN